MNIQTIHLYQYRNYPLCTFHFENNGIHCIYGRNAQGKTNLVEAIYFLSYLRSFRTNQLDSLIMHEKDSMMVDANIETNRRSEQLKIVVDHQKKHLFRYQNSVKKYSDFVGIVNAILFCPDDMSIFHQSPRYRRRFIDMELIKLSHTYTSTLSHYQKLLKQRNVALKQDTIDDVLVATYTEQMIADQITIMKQRSQFIEELLKKASDLYPFFSKHPEQINAKYQTFIEVGENMRASMEDAYAKSLWRDKQYHMTHIGIHKDDIEFQFNGRPIHEVASQGQKRSYLLAIKLGLAQIIYEKKGEYPILLLDDVFSELDSFRKQQLIQCLPKNMQIFITTTEQIDASWFKGKDVYYHYIEDGSIKEVM